MYMCSNVDPLEIKPCEMPLSPKLTVFVWEVVLDVLCEKPLDGLTDAVLLLGDVMVVLSIVPLTDP